MDNFVPRYPTCTVCKKPIEPGKGTSHMHHNCVTYPMPAPEAFVRPSAVEQVVQQAVEELTELTVTTNDPSMIYQAPGAWIEVERTGEAMRVESIRKGETRDVWRTPVAWEWTWRWPFRRPTCWTFDGTVADLGTEPPCKRSRIFTETEMFMQVKRG